jgi:SAM-dependent methyltransferase
MAARWWLDERAHAGGEHLDAEYVEAYDAKSPTDWSDELDRLGALGVGRDSTVVDIGAGTGSFAAALRQRVARVVAVDVSPAMVTLMRERGIEAVEGGFLSYQHQGERPDIVFSRNALHHLPDFWKVIALERVARLLRPRGVLILEDLIYSFRPADAADAIEAWLDAAPADPATGWTADQLAEHVRDEHSTFAWLLEPMFDQAGFDIEDHWHSESRIYAAYICRVRKR